MAPHSWLRPANDNPPDLRQGDLFPKPGRVIIGIDWKTGGEICVSGCVVDGLVIMHEIIEVPAPFRRSN